MAEKTILTKSNVTKGINKTSAIPNELKMRAEFLKVIKKIGVFDICYYCFFIGCGLLCIGLFHNDWHIYLTVAQLYTTIAVCQLLARGRIEGLWINFIDCALYGTICFMSNAYGDMFKTLVISTGFNIYGIVSWSKNGSSTKKSQNVANKQKDELKVRSMSGKLWAIIMACFAACTVGSYFALDALSTALPVIAAITLTMSIIIKYLQMSRYKEAYWFSIIKQILSFAMWLIIFIDAVKKNGDYSALPTMFGGLANIINSVTGLITWNKLYKRNVVNGGVYLAMRPLHITKITKLKRRYHHLTWREDTDHVPSPEEIKLQKRISIAVRSGLFN